MIYKEERGNLFALPQDYMLAHCVSADWALGAGIAVEFQKRFGTRDTLKSLYPNINYNFAFIGKCIPTYHAFNLVTKDKYWMKPTYDALKSALIHMKHCAEINHVKKIGMPKIGCGLDGFNWEKVREIIKEIFKDSDIEIIVCYI